MGTDPAILFYTSDFLTGTLTMSDKNVGKYIRLLCLQHQKGRLTEQDMLFICSTYVEDVYNKFEKDENGLYYNKRMETEIIKRKKYSESRRKNIQKRYEDKPTYVVHMENENENKDKDKKEDEKYKPKFDEIWNLYPVKIGKDRAKNKFKATVKTEKSLCDIKKALNNYLNSDRVKKGYILNGYKWFNNWRDWIDWEEPGKVIIPFDNSQHESWINAAADEFKRMKNKDPDLSDDDIFTRMTFGSYSHNTGIVEELKSRMAKLGK